MTGEELLNEVRLRANEHDITSPLLINRALRRYCRVTSFPWLREVDDAVLVFMDGVSEYLLSDIGLRRIDRIWIQDETSLKWSMLGELDPESFEREARSRRRSDGTDGGDKSLYWKIEDTTVTVTPTPDQTYKGRIDGIAETPVIERQKELPGPKEYHELVAQLAAGYHMQAKARRIQDESTNEFDLTKAQQVMASGRSEEAKALVDIQAFLVRDSTPNRMRHLQWNKTKIAR